MQWPLVLALIACALINGGSSVPLLNNTSANISANDLRSVIREELANAGLGESKDTNININVDAGELFRLKYLGKEWEYAAQSCSEIAERKMNSTPGYYWVQPGKTASTRLVYCDLDRGFATNKRGWLRIVNWNMTNPKQQCPNGFQLVRHSGLRLCGKQNGSPRCSSIRFSVNGFAYQHVCGQARAYQYATPDGFHVNCGNPCTSASPYVDGISITHGNSKRHVWTYAARKRDQPPAFVGDSYFCESSYIYGEHHNHRFFSNPLWDGQHCGSEEPECCRGNTGPWFCTELLERTTDYLEVRLCLNQDRNDEDVPIELLQLYVQ